MSHTQRLCARKPIGGKSSPRLPLPDQPVRQTRRHAPMRPTPRLPSHCPAGASSGACVHRPRAATAATAGPPAVLQGGGQTTQGAKVTGEHAGSGISTSTRLLRQHELGTQRTSCMPCRGWVAPPPRCHPCFLAPPTPPHPTLGTLACPGPTSPEGTKRLWQHMNVHEMPVPFASSDM